VLEACYGPVGKVLVVQHLFLLEPVYGVYLLMLDTCWTATVVQSLEYVAPS
jgi:hypothetical protein